MVARTRLFTRFTVLVVATTLPAFIVLVLLTTQLQAARVQRERADALAQARLVAADMQGVVASARHLAVSLSMPALLAGGEPCSLALRTLQRALPEYAFLSVVDAQLQPLCSTRPPSALDGAARQLVRRTLGGQGFRTDGFARGEDATPYLGFGLPLRSADGAATGLVLGGIDLAWLGRHLAMLDLRADASVTLLDRDEIVLLRQPPAPDWVGQPLPGGLRLQGVAGATGLQPEPSVPRAAPGMSSAGVRQMVGYVPAGWGESGIAVRVGLPLPVGYGLVPPLQRSWYLLTGYSVLSLVAALVLGRRYISRPTAVLLEVVRSWSDGDTTARAVLDQGARTEFGSLARAFNDMAERVGRQRGELERLNLLLETRVAERTQALSASNNRLQVEITERELADAQLRQAQKLQAVGELAGGLAHDFNNLLTTVLGSLELLQRRLAATEERSRTLIAAAVAAAERGGRLTAQLIAFSRKQRLLPVPSDLNATLAGMEGLIASTAGPGIGLETRLQPGLFPVLVDPNQLEAAILNLVLNARDAMEAPGGHAGTLRLLTGSSDGALHPAAPGEAHHPGEVALTPGDYAALAVEDTGCGMTPEVLGRVFEPFFTTKGPGRGSGLGLAQVHGLAHQSGGGVRVSSRLGQGTRVTLLLPRAMLPAPVERASQPGPQVRGVATLLLVDDEADVREVTAETLAEGGHRILVAANGAQALAMLREHGVDLLLADYAMPRMTGLELIREARVLQPGLRVMLVTGYAELGAAAGMDALSPQQVVRKPFRAAELLRRVEAVLSGQHQPA